MSICWKQDGSFDFQDPTNLPISLTEPTGLPTPVTRDVGGLQFKKRCLRMQHPSTLSHRFLLYQRRLAPTFPTHHPEDFITSFETCYPAPTSSIVPAVPNPSTAGSGCFACSAAPVRIFVSRRFTPLALPQLGLSKVQVESNDPAIASCWAYYQELV
jgi:hypothetical protein